MVGDAHQTTENHLRDRRGSSSPHARRWNPRLCQPPQSGGRPTTGYRTRPRETRGMGGGHQAAPRRQTELRGGYGR